VVIGVRSMSRDEKEDNDRIGMRFYSSFDVHRDGIRQVVRDALLHLKTQRVYISLDIDGIDPAYAPATGTPEPFGLSPFDIKTVLELTADRLVGMDIMEVSPPWDQGNTSALAARLAREAILRKELALRRSPSEKR
jgi:agmatinase